MKIRTQFLASMALFGIVISIIAISVLTTNQQVAQLNGQEALTHDIQLGISDLSFLSNDYLLYRDDVKLTLWQSKFSHLSNITSNLNPTTPEQQALVNGIRVDMQRLDAVFTDVVSVLGRAPQNDSLAGNSAFQVSWSRMAVQSLGLISSASQLEHLLDAQVDQLKLTNLMLILALVAMFSAFFIVNYLIVYRNTLKSVADLQAGIGIIGSGNLDHTMKADRRDEIGELSHSFNQMTASLKKVTASKVELEREIDERKRVEEALRESGQRWATTLSSIGDAVIVTDIKGSITFMNRVAEGVTGWTLDEASQRPLREVFNIINENTRQMVDDPVAKVLEKGLIVGLANHTVLVRRDGTDVPIDDSGAPIKDRAGKTTGVVLVFRDITERKNAEEALRADERLYRSIFDNSADGFQLVELIRDEKGQVNDFKFLQVNSAYENQTGLKADFVVGKRAKQVDATMERYWLDMYGTIDDTGITTHTENYNENTKRWFDVYTFSIEKGKVGSLFRDITQRKTMEKQLQDAERLSAIGATAGMVGHDMRNPLQAIEGALFLMDEDIRSLSDSAEKNDLSELLTSVEEGVEYLNKIVADLQDFVRPITPSIKEVDVRSLLEDTLNGIKVPENIQVTVNVQGGLANVRFDPDLMRRVFINLATNAVQAMPRGGLLTVKADKHGEDDVLISFSDTGTGIPEDVKPKLFTPLFTTKSKGQGFGLVVCKRIVEAHGGEITFESEAGKGTTFTIRLPSARK